MGQTQRVNVYKMITRGTIEERISEMMQRKQNLAEQILASASDAWVTELDDEQLRSFLSLGNDFVDETREVGEELLCPQ
jgi:SNF2 family DNA or RNA helicase